MQFTQNLECNVIYHFHNFGVFVFRHTSDKIAFFLAYNFNLCFKGNSLLNLLRWKPNRCTLRGKIMGEGLKESQPREISFRSDLKQNTDSADLTGQRRIFQSLISTTSEAHFLFKVRGWSSEKMRSRLHLHIIPQSRWYICRQEPCRALQQILMSNAWFGLEVSVVWQYKTSSVQGFVVSGLKDGVRHSVWLCKWKQIQVNIRI